MSTGNKDVDAFIAEKLTDEDLFKFCIATRNASICDDDTFWKNRLFKKYGQVEKSANKRWKTFYVQIVYCLNRDLYGRKFNRLNDALQIAGQMGELDVVKFFITQGANDLNWGMLGAAYKGHQRIVEFFMEECEKIGCYIDLESGIKAAEQGGQEEMVEFFEKKR